ncbi:MAG TPA: isoprenylcysteine carboxylmethyltransferase family protein [Acidisarcina sp.]
MSWAQVAKRIRVPLGFAFTALFLWLARPTGRSLLWSLALVVPGVWLRAYASGYVRKNAELAVSGPYAYTRNPLYLGSMMIAFGFAAAARSWWVAGLLAGLFAAIYGPVIRGEEEFLRQAFPEFAEYARRVPRLLPRLRIPGPALSGRGPGPLGEDGGGFSASLYRQHREYQALAGALGVYLALLLRMLWVR